jgi:hypothetical protein
MSNEYVAVLAYATVAFLAFLGGLIWLRYRIFIGRRFRLKNYHENEHSGDHPITQHR